MLAKAASMFIGIILPGYKLIDFSIGCNFCRVQYNIAECACSFKWNFENGI